jgi:hypothetical protein
MQIRRRDSLLNPGNGPAAKNSGELSGRFGIPGRPGLLVEEDVHLTKQRITVTDEANRQNACLRTGRR